MGSFYYYKYGSKRKQNYTRKKKKKRKTMPWATVLLEKKTSLRNYGNSMNEWSRTSKVTEIHCIREYINIDKY